MDSNVAPEADTMDSNVAPEADTMDSYVAPAADKIDFMEQIKRVLENTEFGYYEYEGVVMSTFFPPSALDKIKETAFNDDDIMVVTYPKCGTTWTQQIVWLIQNDGDGRESENIQLHTRWRFVEAEIPGMFSEYDNWASTSPPQLVKSHLSIRFFQKTLDEKKTKFIVVLRNPKDALVSYYHFYKSNVAFKFDGNWNDFFKLFKDKKLSNGDCLDVQLGWWKLRDDPRILVLKFEDMLKAPEDAIRQVMKHMGKSLSDEVVKEITLKTSFKSMKENPLTNYADVPGLRNEISPFMRKGKVGDWKNFFSKEQAEYVDSLSATVFEPEGLFMEDQ